MVIKDCTIGKIYLTTRGLRIRLLRKRPGDVDDVVILSMASGHEIVIPGDTEVHEDTEPSQIVIAEDQLGNAKYRLRMLVFRIIQESGLDSAQIADITPYSKEDIDKEMTDMVGESIGDMHA